MGEGGRSGGRAVERRRGRGQGREGGIEQRGKESVGEGEHVIVLHPKEANPIRSLNPCSSNIDNSRSHKYKFSVLHVLPATDHLLLHLHKHTRCRLHSDLVSFHNYKIHDLFLQLLSKHFFLFLLHIIVLRVLLFVLYIKKHHIFSTYI